MSEIEDLGKVKHYHEFSLSDRIEMDERCKIGGDNLQMQLSQRYLETNMDWGVGIVNAQSEYKFVEHMQSNGVRCFFPETLTVIRKRRGMKDLKGMRATFAGYVFVLLDHQSPQIAMAKRFKTFQRFIVKRENIFLVSQNEINKMFSLQRGGFFNRVHLATFGDEFLRMFPLDSVVRLLAGPYDGYLGTVTKAPEKKGESATIRVLGEDMQINTLDFIRQIV